jgi:prepilin peptidase CpaA
MSPHERITIAVALVACVFDLHNRRIPNVLTFGAASAAFVAAAWAGGPSAVGASVAGWIVAGAVWLPFYLLGGMGAGDVKLMAAIGAWLAPVAAIHAALYTAMAGGVLAVTVACVQGCLPQTYANLQLLVLHWRVSGFTPQAELTLQTTTSPRLPYAIPILVGTVLATWLS